MQLEEFIKDKNVLIFSNNSMDRSGLKDVLVSFGAVRNRIKAVSSWDSAMELIEEGSVQIFFCEFNLSDGINKMHKALGTFLENCPNKNENLSVILGDEKLKGLMADLREEWDLDFSLQRPFTVGKLKEEIAEALKIKEKYSDELKMYYELIGKLAIDALDEEAIKDFLKNHKGAWSYYLSGRYNASNDNLSQAESDYYSALEIDGNHVNSLTELFNLHSINKKWDLALQSVERLAEKNLWGRMDTEKLLMVCLALEEFENIEKIYKYLIQYKNVDESIANALCATASLASKNLFKQSQLDKATVFAKIAVDLNPVKKKLMNHALKTLIAIGEVEYVLEFLNELDDDEMTDDFKGIEFLCNVGGMIPDEIYSNGINLINNGIMSVEIFNLIIEASLNLDQNPAYLVDQAITAFPDYKDHFQAKI